MTDGTSTAGDADRKKLPGNHGQFGVNNATEEHTKLEDAPPATPDSAGTGKVTPRA